MILESQATTGSWHAVSEPLVEGGIAMDFRPLSDTERQRLIDALRSNAQNNRAILMDQRDTSFIGAVEEVTDEEVISAIKSVPCHY
jgi:hypothetical protein